MGTSLLTARPTISVAPGLTSIVCPPEVPTSLKASVMVCGWMSPERCNMPQARGARQRPALGPAVPVVPRFTRLGAEERVARPALAGSVIGGHHVCSFAPGAAILRHARSEERRGGEGGR